MGTIIGKMKKKMIKLIIHNSYINPPSPPPAFAGGGQNLPLSKERGKSSLEIYKV